MARVLLLVVSFLATTAAQQRFDSMGHSLFEVVTPLFSSNSRHLLPIDQNGVDVNGTPIKQFPVDPHQLPLPVPPHSSMPPSPSSLTSQPQQPPPPQPQQPPPPQPQQPPPPQPQQPPPPQPQQPPPSSHPQILPPISPIQIASQRQPAELPHLLFPSSPVMTAPAVPNRLGVLNQDRIRVEGFQPIERRTTKRRRSPKMSDVWSSFSEDASEEDFLPVDISRKLSDVESFDRIDSSVRNDGVEEGSGDSRNFPIIDYTSSTILHPESGYQESATQLSNGLSKFSNVAISRMQQEKAEERSNSITDGEGSAFGEMTEVEDRNVEWPSFRSFNTRLKTANEKTEETANELETTSELPTSTSKSTFSVNLNFTTVGQRSSSTRITDKPVVPSPVTASPNSVPFVRDSRLLRIVKEYAGLIVGSILGIPAIVVLCYFIYLKRLKRYTGTLDVSPRQTICHDKKSESRQTICSQENELACSPSTCASKTPKPPPFPTCKRYVP